jgi:hypothetical protein
LSLARGRRVQRILAKCAGCSRYNLVLSLSHDTTWSNTAEECCAQTLSDARLSPALYPLGSTVGRVLFMKNNTTTSSRGRLVGAEVHACERAPEALLGRMKYLSRFAEIQHIKVARVDEMTNFEVLYLSTRRELTRNFVYVTA